MNNTLGGLYIEFARNIPNLTLIDFKELVKFVTKAQTVTSITPISKVEQTVLAKLLARFKLGEPITYITNSIDFYGYKLKVSNKVLIPRVETEQLIDIALENILDINIDKISILEVGVGSGCIAVSIANKLRELTTAFTYLGIDISQDAINCTEDNLAPFNLQNTVSTATISLLDFISSSSYKQFTHIISNPPYLTKRQMESLDIYVQKEPTSALFGGEDGLDYYKQILQLAKIQLQSFSSLPSLLLEADPEVMGKLKLLIAEIYPSNQVKVINDLFGYQRFIIAQGL